MFFGTYLAEAGGNRFYSKVYAIHLERSLPIPDQDSTKGTPLDLLTHPK